MKNIILSIDRAEKGLELACRKLEQKLGIHIEPIVLIDKEYLKSTYYRGDETGGYFTQRVCDFNDMTELQKILKPFQDRILAVHCRIEAGIQDFIKVIPFLPYVNTPTESSLRWSTEKQLMRDRLAAYDDTLVPKYTPALQHEESNIPEMIKHMTFPMIVKPMGLNSSILVTRCETIEELIVCVKRTFEEIEHIYERERGSGEPGILIEEFMEGDMYSIDAYVDSKGNIFCLPLVKVVTAASIGLEGYYSYRHIIPTGLSSNEAELANECAKKAVRALNLRSCASHIELFRTPSGWKIIELGPRMGGYRQDLYSESYGIDHFYNDLLVRLDFIPEIPTTPLKHAAGMNMYSDTEGIIESVSGIEEANKLESAVWVKSHAAKGDTALFAGNGGALIVDGIFSNVDSDKLEADVAKARELIKIDVRPF